MESNAIKFLICNRSIRLNNKKRIPKSSFTLNNTFKNKKKQFSFPKKEEPLERPKSSNGKIGGFNAFSPVIAPIGISKKSAPKN